MWIRLELILNNMVNFSLFLLVSNEGQPRDSRFILVLPCVRVWLPVTKRAALLFISSS